MPLIYVANGYSNKKKFFLGGGHWLPLNMHVPIWEQPSIPRKSSEKLRNSIISLALLELSQSVSSNCPTEVRVRAWMGTNHGGHEEERGYTPSKKNFAQTSKKR